MAWVSKHQHCQGEGGGMGAQALTSTVTAPCGRSISLGASEAPVVGLLVLFPIDLQFRKAIACLEPVI